MAAGIRRRRRASRMSRPSLRRARSTGIGSATDARLVLILSVHLCERYRHLKYINMNVKSTAYGSRSSIRAQRGRALPRAFSAPEHPGTQPRAFSPAHLPAVRTPFATPRQRARQRQSSTRARDSGTRPRPRPGVEGVISGAGCSELLVNAGDLSRLTDMAMVVLALLANHVDRTILGYDVAGFETARPRLVDERRHSWRRHDRTERLQRFSRISAVD